MVLSKIFNIFLFFLLSKIHHIITINISNTCPENCYDGLCDEETQKCNSCIDGYYTDTCEKVCPSKNCIQCAQDTGLCNKCAENYNLINNFCCKTNCLLCDINSYCSECQSEQQYGTECENCSENCSYTQGQRQCDQSSGNCYQCIPLHYGEKCENECEPYCKECDSEGICNSCEDGYYPDGKYCIECYDNCLNKCEKEKCYECKDGYWGAKCENECPKKCSSANCTQEAGYCPCINNYSYESKCTECINHYDKNTDCTECQEHFTNESYCQNCENYYSLETECQSCIGNYNISTNCTLCNSGTYGNECKKKCGVGCNLTTENCDKDTGECKKCLDKYYGERCDKKNKDK